QPTVVGPLLPVRPSRLLEGELPTVMRAIRAHSMEVRPKVRELLITPRISALIVRDAEQAVIKDLAPTNQLGRHRSPPMVPGNACSVGEDQALRPRGPARDTRHRS